MMKKLLAKIYYQDFELNVKTHFSDNIVLKEDEATFIVQFCFDPEKEDREQFCDGCIMHMNQLNAPVGHPDRSTFEKAGHTSMSIGDYIKFEDGEIWVCKARDWKVIK